MKKILSFLILLATISSTVIFAPSCSDNDDFIDGIFNDSIIKGSVEAGFPTTYRLLDKNMKPTNVITYGEKMFFELIVTNFTNHEMKFQDERCIGETAYCVYTSDGQFVGGAAVAVELIYKPLTLKPGETFRTGEVWARDPLPKGNYYSPLKIKVDDKVINYKLKFKIQ